MIRQAGCWTAWRDVEDEPVPRAGRLAILLLPLCLSVAWLAILCVLRFVVFSLAGSSSPLDEPPA